MRQSWMTLVLLVLLGYIYAIHTKQILDSKPLTNLDLSTAIAMKISDDSMPHYIAAAQDPNTLLESVLSNKQVRSIMHNALNKTDLNQIIACGDLIILKPITNDDNSGIDAAHEINDNNTSKSSKDLPQIHNSSVQKVELNKTEVLCVLMNGDEGIYQLIGHRVGEQINVDGKLHLILMTIKPFNYNAVKVFRIANTSSTAQSSKQDSQFSKPASKLNTYLASAEEMLNLSNQRCKCGDKIKINVKITSLNGKISPMQHTIEMKVGSEEYPQVFGYLAVAAQSCYKAVGILEKKLLMPWINTASFSYNKNNKSDSNFTEKNAEGMIKTYLQLDREEFDSDSLMKVEVWI